MKGLEHYFIILGAWAWAWVWVCDELGGYLHYLGFQALQF